MKVLTVRQPHAQLIALGVKTIETRTKPTKYRGPLLIHAGVRPPKDNTRIGPWDVWREVGVAWTLERNSGRDYHVLPFGAIVASCNLVDCVPVEKIEWVRADWNNNLTWWKCASPNPVLYALTKQRPYGDFTPGRFAWLLEDIEPVEQRCPACWERAIKSGRASHSFDCGICAADGSCAPIPAKGKLGLWNWTPA